MLYAFADFELDEDLFELRLRGEATKIDPKALDLLLYLARNRERVVTKDELFEVLWPGVLVYETALTTCVKRLRTALRAGDAADVLKTVYGQGYRFEGDVAVRTGEAAPDPGGATPRAGDPLVGRAAEREALARLLEGAREARGAVALVTGEAGIGKTSVVEALMDKARQTGVRVLVGRCYEGDEAPPFWPWAQLIRDFARDTGDFTGEELQDVAGDLSVLVPSLGPPAESAAVASGEVARMRLFDSIATFAQRLAAQTPTMLVLEDLHWADESSLRLLARVASEVRHAALLIVGTHRDADTDSRSTVGERLSELRRQPDAHHLPLEPMDETDTRQVVQNAIGGPVSDELAARVYELSDGNPFFAREMASAAKDGSPEDVPEPVRWLIGRRLEPLSAELRQLLEVAAVIGRDFDGELLVRAGRCSEVEAADAIEAAVDLDLAHLVPGAEGHASFRHALAREMVYGGVSRIRKARLHRRVAEALAERAGDEDGRDVPRIAHHFLRATGPEAGDELRRKTIEALERAGDQAERRLAWEDAGDHYEQALVCARALAEPDHALCCRLMTGAGIVHTQGGRVERPTELILESLRVSREHGLAEEFCRAIVPYSSAELAKTFVSSDELVELLEEAVAMVRDIETPVRGAVQTRLALVLSRHPTLVGSTAARRSALAREGVEITLRSGNEAEVTKAFSSQRWASSGPDDLDDRCRASSELAVRAARIGQPDLEVEGHLFLTTDLLERGDLDGVREAEQRLAELGPSSYRAWEVWMTEYMRASRDTVFGRFAEASRGIAESQALAPPGYEQVALAAAAGQVVTQLLAEHKWDELEGGCRGIVDATGHKSALCTLTQALAEQGKRDEALERLAQVAPDRFGEVPRDDHFVVALACLSAAVFAIEAKEHAPMLLELIDPYRGRMAVGGIHVSCVGAVARGAGVLRAVLGDLDGAEQAFDDALALETRMEAWPWWVHTMVARGRARARAGDRDGASEAFSAAKERAATLDSEGYVERIERRAAEVL